MQASKLADLIQSLRPAALYVSSLAGAITSLGNGSSPKCDESWDRFGRPPVRTRRVDLRSSSARLGEGAGQASREFASPCLTGKQSPSSFCSPMSSGGASSMRRSSQGQDMQSSALLDGPM
ncbi:unnamed protein product [Pleuronectes platessa]|uniref:Uncharacterized protein n=1 Tax=Pleuronectes platessa TaxID=8262 RepID=A0A9N7TP07_PLEPL|nr:unnamed protein product [Pleuronectes platessa]